MKKSSSILNIILLLFFCLILGACAKQEENPRDKVCSLYNSGQYEEAEPLFLALLETDMTDSVISFGHACNLLKLDRKAQAKDELERLNGTVLDAEAALFIKEKLFEIYLDEKDFEKAAVLSDELMLMYPAGSGQNDYYRLQSSIIRAAAFRQQADYLKLADELKTIIGLKEFAEEEYLELFSIYRKLDMRTEAVETAQDIYYYMNGHSDYITDASNVITTMLDAAAVSAYCDGDASFFYDAAQQFISLAEDKGVTQEQLLKYKIIVAECQGRMETAYKLLGVYLNHMPEDAQAIKERDYLEMRLKCATD